MPEATNIVEAPITPLNTRAGSVAPPSTGEIHVVPQPITPTAPPSPGSAKDRMFSKLRTIARDPGQSAAPAVTPTAAPTPAPSAPAAEPTPEPVEKFDMGEDAEDEKPPAPAAAPAATPATTATPATDPKKVSPWKLVDEWKERARKVETEISEMKKLIPNEEQRKAELAEVERLRAHAKELEDEIRYQNYSKHPEYQEKYQKPYEDAWRKAMSDVAEIRVADETGDERAASAQDIMQLVNLPMGEAFKIAEEKFGNLAPVVMQHRTKIREVFEAQQKALEDARKGGAEREQQRAAQFTQMRDAIAKESAGHWQHFNEAVPKDPKFGKYFTPQEGDEEGNTKLQKGLKLVDESLAVSPMDPRLSAEQRREVVRRHTAIRYRAAAFGRLVHQVSSKDARIAQLEAELKQYKGSEPEAGGSTSHQPIAPPSARNSVLAALHRLAK